MDDLYSPLRLVHIGAVTASGALFALRGLALNLGAAWPRAKPVRRLSYAVDTVLLAAAIALTVQTGQYPFVDPWLTAKVLLLLIYIGLGFAAFWRSDRPALRALCFVAALAVFGFIVTVALAHDPRGIFAL